MPRGAKHKKHMWTAWANSNEHSAMNPAEGIVGPAFRQDENQKANTKYNPEYFNHSFPFQPNTLTLI